MTKSCHDIDLILWLLCSPPHGKYKEHLPSHISSSGALSYFKRSRKPPLAGEATNCLKCPAERECIYSAKKIYNERHLAEGNAGWPIHIVDPEIEDCFLTQGYDAAEEKLMSKLAEDYSKNTPQSIIDGRPWFGRCVYESNNDVCDDQTVTITWGDDPLSPDEELDPSKRLKGRGSKTASFHMVAFTEKQCERRGRIYGTRGEIEYDSKTIRVYDFASGQSEVYKPHQPGGGHGGGDDALARQYINAIDAVKTQRLSVKEAQIKHVGCSLEEIIRSHAVVFAAEESRKERKVVAWSDWWKMKVEG